MRKRTGEKFIYYYTSNEEGNGYIIFDNGKPKSILCYVIVYSKTLGEVLNGYTDRIDWQTYNGLTPVNFWEFKKIRKLQNPVDQMWSLKNYKGE